MANFRLNRHSNILDSAASFTGSESERTISTQEPIISVRSSLLSESRTQYMPTESNDDIMPSSRRSSILFIEALRNRDSDTEQLLLNTFQAFDTDGDGFISPAELRYVMSLIGEFMTVDEAEDLIREVDLDKDGKLSYWEFVKIMED